MPSCNSIPIRREEQEVVFICTSVPVFFTPTMSICRAIESRELYKYNYTEEQTSFRYDELNTGTVREQEK
jgi:hypothetical protein